MAKKEKEGKKRAIRCCAAAASLPLFVDGLIVAFLFLSFPIFHSFRHCAGNRSHSPFPPPPTDDKTTDRERERILHLPQKKSGGGGGKDLHGFSLSAHGDAGKGKRKRENGMRCGGERRLLPAAERLSMHLPIQKRKTPKADTSSCVARREMVVAAGKLGFLFFIFSFFGVLFTREITICAGKMERGSNREQLRCDSRTSRGKRRACQRQSRCMRNERGYEKYF